MSHPTPPHVIPGVTQEQARAALENAAEQLAPFQATMRQVARAYAENARQVFKAFRPIVDHFQQHPELLELWRQEREAAEQLGSCHCLCGIHHREQPSIECAGAAEPGLTMRFDSPTVGTQHVTMCGPCYAFHQDRRIEQLTGRLADWQRPILQRAVSARRPEPLPATEAIADTCTCHCWANHRDEFGVCEAASSRGVKIDGQPACYECAEASARHKADGATVDIDEASGAVTIVIYDGHSVRHVRTTPEGTR